MDTSVVRTRAIFRGATSSLQRNNFANQFLHDINKLFEHTNENSSQISSDMETFTNLNSELQSRICNIENILSAMASKL